jgi:hypothetical protein
MSNAAEWLMMFSYHKVYGPAKHLIYGALAVLKNDFH